ncbi:glycosyl hydrolase family 61-domain-containing protein [Ganoderma leucocontextum]|nr:glycosyl hydrolase family 61-domain-containing protein [Ganoderma leucocontextum]
MIFTSTTLVSFSLLASQVAAHGYVQWVFANGRNYTGDNVDDPQGIPTPIRTVNGRGPIVDVTSQYIACGNQAEVVSEEALVDAGSTIEIRWSPSWPHNVGSMTAWMAECGGTDCTKFQDLGQAQWFKIDEKGVDPATGQWYLGEIFQNPATPGGGGAELYPQCIQLSVQGSGNLVPQSSDYVHFPGAYKATDPGLTFAPGDQQKSQYQIPGGPLATLVQASDQPVETGTSNAASGRASTSMTDDDQTSATTPTTSTKTSMEPNQTTVSSPSSADGSDSTEPCTGSTTSTPAEACSGKSMKRRRGVTS